MLRTLIVITALLAQPAYAVSCNNVEKPPAKYDYTPTKTIKVKYVNQRDLNMWAQIGFGKAVQGCGFYNADAGEIYLLKSLRGKPRARARVLAHEYGHVNGWRH